MAKRAHIITIGNEKGGSGKSTMTMHIAACLMNDGLRVATIDLDVRQQTLSRFLRNRASLNAAASSGTLVMPTHRLLEFSDLDDKSRSQGRERMLFETTVEELLASHDVLLMDCPGTDNWFVRLAHSRADTLLSPINDSFIDLDLFAHIDPMSMKITRPSVYAEMVWEARKMRAQTGKRPVDWVVVRNRLATVQSNNHQRMGEKLHELSRRIGFRIANGLTERTIYRELFPSGLTLLDLPYREVPIKRGRLTMSHIAARQEIRRLVKDLKLPLAPPQEEHAARPPLETAL